MLTPTESAALRQEHADFMQRCTSYKALLTNSGLPFSVDLPTLTTAYGQQLFEQLLTLDKGLKARYDLLRTDEGKQKLLAATIDTAGHEVMDQVSAALTALTQAYQGISLGMSLGWLHNKYSLAQFAQYYELDLARVLEALTIDWTGKEYVLAYFTQIGDELTRLRDLFRPLVGTSAPLGVVFEVLASCYHVQPTNEPLTVDERHLHQRIMPELSKRQVLSMIPRASK
ncbi:hypothetical protein [Hymenobacter baengnokdamensis]|uniref:hypothetical protein n=1 Tax=Hymenobacter baengnokdamensis TaxID=2615203 RepID=UPI0012472E61|nr:hypothetical protein [Hymenobacter baengnokdamensis]